MRASPSFHTPATSISDGYEPYHSDVLLPAFSLALAFRPPRHSTITDRITRCRRRRCQLQQHQRQSRPPSLPHDMPIIWARCHRQSHPVRCADPSYSLPRQNGRRGIGGIWIRRPPCRDAVGMGRGSREWARCWKRQHCSSC
jgi:hypothetical protein